MSASRSARSEGPGGAGAAVNGAVASTSQIDAESEAKIHLALKQFVRGRTTFLITHRLSTLELADRIVAVANDEDLPAHGEAVRARFL